MSLVRFWIFLEGKVFLSPKIDPEEPIAALLDEVAVSPTRPQQLTSAVLSESTLYKFLPPLPSRNPKQKLVAACRDAKKDIIWDTFSVKDLADKEKLCADYVCLVIETPKGQHDEVISELQRKHAALLTALQINVAVIHDFSEEDVTGNLKDGHFWRHGEECTDEGIEKLESELAKRRVYTPDALAGDARDISIAKWYPTHFATYCAVAAEGEAEIDPGHAITNSRELIALFSLFRCHAEDVDRIAELDATSSLKAKHISSHFLLPAFFACQPSNSKLLFRSEMSWNFPIFLATTAESSALCKYKPRSDFGVSVNRFGIPLLVCEVISMKKEGDRWRMLLQGIAVARAMHCIKKENSKTRLFVVAIYVRSTLVAQRYIIQANGPAGEVAIAQKDFDLQTSSDSRQFLKELYNLQMKLDEMAEALDDDKKDDLKNIAKAAMLITSYTQRAKETQKTTKSKSKGTRGTSDLESVPEEDADFTQDDDVQDRLNDMGYVSDFIVYGHPNVAMISRVSDRTDRGFLKFTRTRTEVQILEYLSKIEDPDNHTIPGGNAWQRDCGGFVIFTSSGGGHLTDLRQPDEHAWSAAKQLVAGVAFMHKHNVAHLDIKPSNVHIPVGGGRLSINDFSVAVWIRTPGKKYRGTVGTEGYMAPEIVAKDAYDPIRSDLWSCGRTLEEMISHCRRITRERDFLVEIARQLMHDNPLERLTMSGVLAQMTAFESCTVDPPLLRRVYF
ncbi:hypothetical protein JVU11DRAFT_9132 [Chiua virens]|nr:hypothetical protein JVU11DRAFT_9132 [Chiua virens]